MDSSHLDMSKQHAALLCRVCTFPADKDDSKWTPPRACALLFQDIDERIKVPDGDLNTFSFGHACGQDTQCPDACVMLWFRDVSSHIQDVMQHLFDPAKLHFAAWVWLHNVD